MVQTALTVKRLGVLAARWEVVGEPQRVRFIQDCFERMQGSPGDVLMQAMDAFAKGWSVQELVLEPDGERLWLKAARPVNPSQVGLKVDAFGNVESLIHTVPGEPERVLPIGKFVVYRHRGGYGRLRGRSDLDAAYPHFVAKRDLVAAWKLHLERFASPTMVAKCGPSVSANDRSEMGRALDSIHRTTSLVFPADVELAPIVAGRDGSTTFMDAIEFHNREIARSILGQTLTTDEGRRVGSLAMGKVHLQVLLIQLDAIRKELADTVMTEQVIRPLVELNFGPGQIPRFRFAESNLAAFRDGEI